MAETTIPPVGKDALEAAASCAAPLIELRGIGKSFGKVIANDDISLTIRAGRILALLGENGAGKSTLMSMLSGRYQPDAGVILVDGSPVRFTSPRDAITAGIGMVYQHFMLVPTMSVAQNVLLGQEGGLVVSPAAMERRVGELAQKYGLGVDPAARIEDLSMGERQRVEILRLLARDSRVLILDEPTAVLTPPEVGQLFAALKRIVADTERGRAVVFISHKLEEVLSLANDMVVLRRGRVVHTMESGEVASKAELAERMVGRPVVLSLDREQTAVGETVLEVQGLKADGPGGGVDGVTLRLRQGEVLAVVGVAGNGQQPLVEVLAGLRAPRDGQVRILSRPWDEFFSPPVSGRGLGYVPEDRLGVAAVGAVSLTENVLITRREAFSRGPLLDTASAKQATVGLIKDFGVVPADEAALGSQLSGGNLQKLILARELSSRPQLLIADQPTQGLDVSATEEVWQRLLAAREHAGILLVTGDVAEALELADRIAVMFRGRFMDVFSAHDQAKVGRIGLAMAGVGA